MPKFFLFALLVSSANAAYIVKQTSGVDGIKIESASWIDKKITKRLVLKDIRESIAEKDESSAISYQEIMVPDEQASKLIKNLARQKAFSPMARGSKVWEVIKQGPDNNRIVLTILGDGYTLEEEQKYREDVQRIVNDLFGGKTFKSFLPLFNIYAVFVPSSDSGISDIESKSTAFDLYRSPKGSKRGIMPGDRGAIEDALRMVGAYTDYPVIIANDDFYGGLGGRYAITTRSLNSGSMVLRHELGHNFSNVGEEYDGGQVYSGANFSSSSNVSWKHWIEGEAQVHNAKFLTGAYVWQNLFEDDFVQEFNFPNLKDHSFFLKLSSVGWSNQDDVGVMLDGKELELEGVYTEDRSFFGTKSVELSAGKHEIRIEDRSRDGNNVLAYANGYAYPKDYNFTYGKVAAYNVFDESGWQRGYRPTHNQCLMRDMRSEVFCPVDQENIWLRFLNKVSVIDSIEVSEGESTEVRVHTPELPNLDYRWYKKGFFNREELTELRGKRQVLKSALGRGSFEVEASFSTPEIRKKSENLSSKKTFKIK